VKPAYSPTLILFSSSLPALPVQETQRHQTDRIQEAEETPEPGFDPKTPCSYYRRCYVNSVGRSGILIEPTMADSTLKRCWGSEIWPHVPRLARERPPVRETPTRLHTPLLRVQSAALSKRGRGSPSFFGSAWAGELHSATATGTFQYVDSKDASLGQGIIARPGSDTLLLGTSARMEIASRSFLESH
jgi:hypothetical protein